MERIDQAEVSPTQTWLPTENGHTLLCREPGFSLLNPPHARIMLHMGAVLQLPMLYRPMGVLLTRPVAFVSPDLFITAIIHPYSYPANGRAGGELLKGGSQHTTAS